MGATNLSYSLIFHENRQSLFRALLIRGNNIQLTVVIDICDSHRTCSLRTVTDRLTESAVSTTEQHRKKVVVSGDDRVDLSTGAKTIEREDGTEVELTAALDRKRRIDTAYEHSLIRALDTSGHSE